jgi:NADH-quinone oxidoreductase subunit J
MSGETVSWGVAIWAAGLALLSAVLAVSRPSPVHALLLLLAALVALAVAFFAVSAAFAGAVQLLIYAGAIVAVFVFVVMTVDPGPEAMARERARLRGAWLLPGAVAALAVLPLLVGLAGDGVAPATSGNIGAGALGGLLFGRWALVTELVSLLLVAAMIGVRLLGRRVRPEDRR